MYSKKHVFMIDIHSELYLGCMEINVSNGYFLRQIQIIIPAIAGFKDNTPPKLTCHAQRPIRDSVGANLLRQIVRMKRSRKRLTRAVS